MSLTASSALAQNLGAKCADAVENFLAAAAAATIEGEEILRRATLVRSTWDILTPKSRDV